LYTKYLCIQVKYWTSHKRDRPEDDNLGAMITFLYHIPVEIVPSDFSETHRE
jgi:hypothetical protein